MARKLLKRFIPTTAAIKSNPALHFLGDLLHDPNLFHLNRHSVSVAFLAGIFIAFLPIPGQMPLAAIAALTLRCNLPLTVALVWITNPITMPPVFFACYQVGRWMMQMEPTTMALQFNWDSISHKFAVIWKPLLLGSVTCGLVFGCLGYVVMQLFWRWHVVQNWEKRKKKRRAAEAQRIADAAAAETRTNKEEPTDIDEIK